MRRLHLFEFGDQRWFPRILRDAETSYLATAYRFSPMLARRWAEKISTVLQAGEPAEILDMCSGSGGPMPAIVEELEKLGYYARATLTDLYPNPKSDSHPRIAWLPEPVDAAHVSPNLTGVRTMFSAFHHFRPDTAKAILGDAFDRRRPICIFEAGSRTPLAAGTMLGVPVAVLALMPFARPFRWAYMLFTYLIPLLPLIILWDGMVSLLRIYSPEEMKKLTEDMHAPGYAWEIGRIQVRGIPYGLPYLIGRPIP
ncbi:MAG: hypothetical protein ACKV2U_14255 [Bryobacteraceae bacterium]